MRSRMNAELLAKYDRPVPRYTSYPTAPHFHAGIGPAVYREWLAEVPAGAPLSIYLHAPFCRELCWYCGCHTTVVRHYEPVAGYLELLRRELDLVAGALGGRPRTVHLHLGGGTPTMLAPEICAGLASGCANASRSRRTPRSPSKSIRAACPVRPSMPWPRSGSTARVSACRT